jgi:predicted amidohydrolase
MLTIALAQLKGTLYDKAFNLHRTISTIEWCKKKHVDYILFPELFLSGYLIKERITEMAEPIDGRSIRLIQEKAKEIGIGVVIGFPEYYDNRYYNSAAFIEKDGSIKGLYRKIHLFDTEKDFFTPGEEFPIVRTTAGNIALMMTFDIEFPEMARVYALNGAELLMVLNAHSVPYEPHQEIFLRSRALENEIFVAAANKVGLEESTLYFGESAVIAPDGNFVVRGGNNEEITVVSIDLSDVYKTREKQPMKYLENRKSKLYMTHGLI